MSGHPSRRAATPGRRPNRNFQAHRPRRRSPSKEEDDARSSDPSGPYQHRIAQTTHPCAKPYMHAPPVPSPDNERGDRLALGDLLPSVRSPGRRGRRPSTLGCSARKSAPGSAAALNPYRSLTRRARAGMRHTRRMGRRSRNSCSRSGRPIRLGGRKDGPSSACSRVSRALALEARLVLEDPRARRRRVALAADRDQQIRLRPAPRLHATVIRSSNWAAAFSKPLRVGTSIVSQRGRH